MKRSAAEEYLLKLFDQETWVLKIGPQWSLIQVPTWDDARYLVRHYREVLGGWAMTLPLFVQYGQQVMQINRRGEMSTAQVDGLVVNRALLDVFGMMLSSPERSLGLVRLADERQISVNGGANGKYLIGMTQAEAVRLKREDYWHPADLYEFNQNWRQRMSVSGEQWFEWRYRSFDPMAENPGPNKCDYWFITRYRLIEGPRGGLFHLAENLGMEEIKANSYTDWQLSNGETWTVEDGANG